MRYVHDTISFIRSHPIDTGLIVVALGISIISFIPRDSAQKTAIQGAITQVTNIPKQPQPTLLVEVSGAVVKPDVYQVPVGTYMKEVIALAGGLTEDADKLYVGRNYNLAKQVGDQEKIHIPYLWEVQSGTFYEQKRILEYLQPLYQNPPTGGHSIGQAPENLKGGLTISINTASSQELDTLPGVGPVTAQKIIDSRPYTSIDQLLERKVMNSSTFEKVKDLISI